MRRTRTLALIGVLPFALGNAAGPCWLVPGSLATTPAMAAETARWADRQLGWSLQTIELLREELRHADFSDSPRSWRERHDLLRALVRTGAQPWLDLERAACRCNEAAPACTRLEANAERLRATLPRKSLHGIDIDRLTKGR